MINAKALFLRTGASTGHLHKVLRNNSKLSTKNENVRFKCHVAPIFYFHYNEKERHYCCYYYYLYINTLTLGEVWQYLLPGADLHSPLSMFLRLLILVASDLTIGDVFKKHNGCYLLLFFYLSDKDRNSPTVAELSGATHQMAQP